MATEAGRGVAVKRAGAKEGGRGVLGDDWEMFGTMICSSSLDSRESVGTETRLPESESEIVKADVACTRTTSKSLSL